jgi:hypothetical protein
MAKHLVIRPCHQTAYAYDDSPYFRVLLAHGILTGNDNAYRRPQILSAAPSERSEKAYF